MNNKRILKNMGISMLMKPISMVLSFIYTPLALAFLGQTKYGVWSIILSVISWINYFDIGIGNGLRNKLAESYALGDTEKCKKYVSTAYCGTSIISCIFCVALISIWHLFSLSDFFNISLNDENVNTVVFTSIIFVCVNFVLSLSRTSAYAIQQPGIISVIGVLGQVIQIVAIWLVSRVFQNNLMVVAVLYGVISLFDNLIIQKSVSRERRFLVPSISYVEMASLKPLLTLGAGFFVMQICSLVLNTTDNLLISNLYGSSEVTPYNIVYKVFYMVVQIHAIIIMPMWSAYTEASAKKDILWIKATMKKINLVTAVFSVGTVVGIFLFEPFAAIWLGTKLEYGKSLIIIVAVYMIVQMFGNNYSSFLCGVGNVKWPAIISIIGAIINIPLSVFFAQVMNMRLAGIILGSLCVMAMSIFVFPSVSKKWLEQKEAEWLKEN